MEHPSMQKPTTVTQATEKDFSGQTRGQAFTPDACWHYAHVAFKPNNIQA